MSLAAAMVLIAPSVASAEQLVPLACTRANPNAPSDCGSCELIQLINNVIQFILVIGSSVVTLIFIYAGFLYLTAGGNSSNIGKANSIFGNVAIGYVIILGSFLAVDLFFATLINPGSPIFTWKTIQCFSPTTPKFDERAAGGGGSIVGGIDPSTLAANAAVCGDTYLSAWGSESNNAKCILQNESACGSLLRSTTDISADNNSFSYGAFQVNISANTIQNCPGFGDLNCPSAWSGRDYSARVVDVDLFTKCRAAALDPKCNAINARRIYDESLARTGNGWKPWGARTKCGL